MSAPVLSASLTLDSPEAQARAEHNRSLAAALRAKVAETALEGRSFLLDIAARTKEIRRELIGV